MQVNEDRGGVIELGADMPVAIVVPSCYWPSHTAGYGGFEAYFSQEPTYHNIRLGTHSFRKVKPALDDKIELMFRRDPYSEKTKNWIEDNSEEIPTDWMVGRYVVVDRVAQAGEGNSSSLTSNNTSGPTDKDDCFVIKLGPDGSFDPKGLILKLNLAPDYINSIAPCDLPIISRVELPEDLKIDLSRAFIPVPPQPKVEEPPI